MAVQMLRCGEKVGSYVVEALLETGTGATTWRVRHALLGTTHALKLLHGQRLALGGLEELLRAKLRHPNVVELRELLTHQGWPALVLEYVDGPTLEQQLARGPLSLRRADELATGILQGLRAVHDSGLLHLALQPAIIRLAQDSAGWVPKLGDLGLGSLGAAACPAPEQLEDPPRADERSDLFSLGCVLYEMLAGRPAFAGHTALERRDRVRAGDYVPLGRIRSDLPPRMLHAVERCLAVEPEQRPADCDELLALWGGFYVAPRPLARRTLPFRAAPTLPPALRRTIAPRPAQAPAPSPRGARGHRWARLLLAALTLGLLTVSLLASGPRWLRLSKGASLEVAASQER